MPGVEHRGDPVPVVDALLVVRVANEDDRVTGADQVVDSFVGPAGNALDLGGGQGMLGDVLAG
jgi:hypothetical protein